MLQSADYAVLDTVKKLFNNKFHEIKNVKKAEVVWICSQLKGFDIKPTVEKVIYVRGYRGTPHVIKRHIEVWEASSPQAAAPTSLSKSTQDASKETDEKVVERIRKESLEKPVIGLGIILDRIKSLEEKVAALEKKSSAPAVAATMVPHGVTPMGPKALVNGYFSTDRATSRKPIDLPKPAHGSGASPHSPFGYSDVTAMWVEIQEKINELDLKPLELNLSGEQLGIGQIKWMLGTIEIPGRDYCHYVFEFDKFSPYLIVKHDKLGSGSICRGNLILHRVGSNFIEGLEPGGNRASPRDVRAALKHVHEQLYPHVV